MDWKKENIWGFSLDSQGKLVTGIEKFSYLLLDKLMNACFDQRWNFQYYGNLRSMVVEMPKERWHFFGTEQEAIDFLDFIIRTPRLSVADLLKL